MHDLRLASIRPHPCHVVSGGQRRPREETVNRSLMIDDRNIFIQFSISFWGRKGAMGREGKAYESNLIRKREMGDWARSAQADEDLEQGAINSKVDRRCRQEKLKTSILIASRL